MEKLNVSALEQKMSKMSLENIVTLESKNFLESKTAKAKRLDKPTWESSIGQK